MPTVQIAIDGPAGAGKSTVAKHVAKHLNITYIDTGAMYRAITLKALQLNIDLDDAKSYIFVKDTAFQFNDHHIYMDGVDVSAKIRETNVTAHVSKVSSVPYVRQALVALQRDLAKTESVVMDGRDIGTNVLVDATHKFFLTATIDERARRRYYDNLNRGIKSNLDDIKKDIARRDYLDTTRQVNPLKPAEDAVIIDTSNLTLDEVITLIIENIGEVEEHGI
ncbi:MAG: (d)CMP kinase [Candidatus Izemoplasma sp.]|nr:(d)CMP kinase [Candidatus Izemoplasma sp.]